MSDKGVHTPPTWIDAIRDPHAIDKRRQKNLKLARTSKVQQLIADMEILANERTGQSTKDKVISNFYLKQITLPNGCEIKNTNISGSIKDILSKILANDDQDPLLLAARQKPERITRDDEFPIKILEALHDSPSGCVSAQLTNGLDTNTLAFVILKSESGIRIIDKKQSIELEVQDTSNFKSALNAYLENLYPDYQKAQIIKFGPNLQEKAQQLLDPNQRATHSDTKRFSKGQLYQDRIALEAQAKKVAKEEDKKEVKPLDSPPTTPTSTRKK